MCAFCLGLYSKHFYVRRHIRYINIKISFNVFKQCTIWECILYHKCVCFILSLQDAKDSRRSQKSVNQLAESCAFPKDDMMQSTKTCKFSLFFTLNSNLLFCIFPTKIFIYIIYNMVTFGGLSQWLDSVSFKY